MISIRRFKFVLLALSVTASSVSVSQTKSQEIDSLKSSEAVESRIKGMITENLNLFLNENDYRVFATANIKKYRQKIILDGELESKTSGKEKKAGGNKGLPGFSNIDKKKASSKNVDRKEKKRFTFKNRTKLTKLSVRLVLEEKLSPKIKELAVKTSKESIALAVGKVGEFELVELDLTAPESKNTAWTWLVTHLDKKGGDAIDLLYLSLLALAFLASLLGMVFFFRSKRASKEAMNNESKISEVVDQKEVDSQCSQKMDELISLLNSSPLIARNFLQNLSLEDKKFLYRSLRTPSLRNFFGKVLKIEQPEEPDRNRQDAGEVFGTILTDLKRYILLNKVMESKPFGYLPVLTGTQIARFIANEKDRSLTLSIVAPYLADHQVSEVTKTLTISEKAGFIGRMRDENGELIAQGSDSAIDTATLKSEIDAKLRETYGTIREEAVVDISETNCLETAFLESDMECVDVIKQLAAKHGKIPTKYEKYLVGFEDLLGLDLGIGKRVMQRVSNEVIIIALADTKIDSRMVKMLGDIRSQLIKSLMKRESNVSKSDIENAKNEILRLYRTTV
jgi:hypothetical protein